MTALSLDNVCVSYPGRIALKNVTAGFTSGAVTGLVGPNGAGKTTLFRVAVRLLKPERGTVQLLDRPLAEWSSPELARAVAYLPQNAEAHWPIAARRLVALGRLPHRAMFAPLSPQDARAVEESLARCDAEALATRRMNELSAGERARVLLARALAVNAPVLLVDEPAAHLDPSHQLRLMALLRMEASRGTAVAATLHDLSLASRFCDEIIVMDKGGIVEQGAPDSALNEGTLEAVFSVTAKRIDDTIIVPWQHI